MEIVSIFEVREYKSKDKYREFIEGYGQEAISFIRKEYPKFTKFVLKGFEVNGKFIPLNLKTWNNVR